MNATVWDPGLMSKYAGVAQYDGYDGPHYQCAACYSRSLTATAPTVPVSVPPKQEPPPGATCACGTVIRPLYPV